MLVGGLSIAAASALFVGVGSTKEAVKVDAGAGDGVWYLRGSMNGWLNDTSAYNPDDYKIVNNGSPLIIELTEAQEFKVVGTYTSDWSETLTTSAGDASGNGITFNYGVNSYVDRTGWYAFSIQNNALLVDFGELYYTGDDNSWGIEPDADHPAVRVNGGVVQWTLSTGEKFKLRGTETWSKGVFGYDESYLKTKDFYGSFKCSEDDDKNIVSELDGTYDVKMELKNRNWSLSLYPHGVDPDDTAKVYVLDKYGDLLSSNAYAYTQNAAGQKTGTPGSPLAKYSGPELTNHMYYLEFWTGMETVEFNNGKDGTWSYSWDISADGQYTNRGKCLILDGSLSGGKWSSGTWVSKEVGYFIEKYMHFANYHETEKGSGECISQGWYTNAKDAYVDLDPAYQAELSGLDYVVARLDAWAVAYNHTHFTVTAGIGAFGAPTVNPMNSIETNNVFAIVAIASVTLVTLGGVFLLRRKEN